jgi:hypothetical protein
MATTKVYKCKSGEFPQVRYGKPVKGRSGYTVSCENRERNLDLLFQTTPLEVVSYDGETIVLGLAHPEDPMHTFFETSATLHLEEATKRTEEWFPGKNVSPDLLPDLWKETIQKEKIKIKVNQDSEEPVLFFDCERNPLEKLPTEPGTRVICLLRLDSLWFSKASLGESYTLIQAMLQEPLLAPPPSPVTECALNP